MYYETTDRKERQLAGGNGMERKKTNTVQRRNMVHSPRKHIPLGEGCTVENGKPGLRIKKGPGDYEEISLEDLNELVRRKLASNE